MVLVEIHVTGQLQLALKRPLIGWDYHATHTPYSRGISILIAKTVQFGIISVHVDPQGRFVFLHGTIYGKPYLILACYIPLPYNSDQCGISVYGPISYDPSHMAWGLYYGP